jgi:hypothetical protein
MQIFESQLKSVPASGCLQEAGGSQQGQLLSSAADRDQIVKKREHVHLVVGQRSMSLCFNGGDDAASAAALVTAVA